MITLQSATRAVMVIFAIACSALIAVFFWTVSALTQPYEVLQQFRDMREKVLVTVAVNLDDYYRTSNSMSIKSAQDTVTQVVNDLNRLPSYVQLQLQMPLLTLQRSLNEEISVGGEMAANPDALLEQNEREMSGWLTNVLQYADAASAARAQDASRYRQVALNMRESLHQLSISRESAFRGGEQQENAFVSHLRQLELGLAQLRQLPLMGIVSAQDESDDELTLGIERRRKLQARDQASEHQEELASLIARYPREWGFALRDMRSAQRAQMALKAELSAVNNALNTADTVLNDWRQHDSEKALQLFLSVTVLIMALVAAIAWNVRRRIIVPLARTSNAIREIDDAHGWQLNVPEHSVMELRQLAENINEFIKQVRNEKALNRKVA